MQEPETLWFLNSHVTVQLSYADNADGISILNFVQRRDDAPPLHVHHTEDEIFHVLDGELRFVVGDRAVVAGTGQTVLGPRGIPHGYRVLSDLARMLVINRGGFERLVRSGARPALTSGPPELSAPTPEMQAHLAALCLAQGIELLGPPIP